MFRSIQIITQSFRLQQVHFHVSRRLKGTRRDKTEHIAQILQRCELPVVAVATAAHGPGDEGSRRRRSEDPYEGVEKLAAMKRIANRHLFGEFDGVESSTVFKRVVANASQLLRECEAVESSTVFKRVGANAGQAVRKYDGLKSSAFRKCGRANTRQGLGQYEGGEFTTVLKSTVADAG